MLVEFPHQVTFEFVRGGIFKMRAVCRCGWMLTADYPYTDELYWRARQHFEEVRSSRAG